VPDMLVVVPDRPFKKLIEALGARSAELQIGSFTCSIYVHPHRDAGVRKRGHILARVNRSRGMDQEQFALVLFDHHGSGCNRTREECEAQVEQNLCRVNFGTKVACVCVSPEFERWLFTDLRELARVIELPIEKIAEYKCAAEKHNPDDLEKQFEFMCRRLVRNGTGALDLEEILNHVDFGKWLIDPSFAKLLNALRNWFPSDL